MTAFRACYRIAARAAGRTVRASARVAFEVGERRAAQNIRVSGAALPGLAACLEGAASRIRTRIAPDVGNAQVTLNLAFDPTGP